jgi:NADP-dependent 3-hydroxy acid dehydrogenase YdfG
MNSSEQLQGTVALVTGASSGIGEATAVALAQRGARVALAARRKDRLQQVAERLGDSALVIEADVSDAEQAGAAVQQTVDELGRLDILINNAGVMLLGPVQDAPLEEWERMIDVNVNGLLYCAHAALPHLIGAAEDGPRQVADMVNLSSVAGRVARRGSGVYNLTKFGVGAFSEALRQEAVSAHIRITLIEPGFVGTELQGHNEIPAVREAIESMQAEIGEILSADDIANAILYAVTQPPHVAVNEVLVRPTGQAR